MNKSYKTLFNVHTQAWVAVSENTAARGKRSGSKAVAGVLISAASLLGIVSEAQAADAVCVIPGSTTQNGNVSAGTADEVACGQGAVVSGQNSTAVGANSNASGGGSVALGVKATAINPYATSDTSAATALGAWTYANGDQAVAVGARARAEVRQSIAIGNDTRATGEGSVSIGGDDSGGGYSGYAFTVGYLPGGAQYRQTFSSGDASTAISAHAQALTKGSTAVGVGATAGEGVMGTRGPDVNGVAVAPWTPSTTSIEATAVGALSYAKSAQTTAVGYQA